MSSSKDSIKIVYGLLLGALLVTVGICYSTYPVLFGVDPYVRMYHEGEWIVNMQGRNWPPLLQWVINLICAMGGEVEHVKAAGLASGLVMLTLLSLFAWRTNGFIAALIWPFMLAVDPDMMVILASSYQETWFYIFFGIVLLVLSRNRESISKTRLSVMCLCIYLACLTRYEGVLLSGALLAVLGGQVLFSRQDPKLLRLVGLGLLLAVIPLAYWAGYTGMHDEEHSALSKGFSFRVVKKTGMALLIYARHAWYLPLLLLPVVMCFRSKSRQALLTREMWVFHLYVGLFVLCFLVIAPYQPVDNARGRVALVLYATYLIAWAVAAITREVGRQEPGLKASSVGIVAIALFSLSQIQRSADLYANRCRRGLLPYETAQEINAAVVKDRPLYIAWPVGNYHGHADHHNMVILTYLDGPVSRATFNNSPLAGASAEARAEDLIRSYGGYLCYAKTRTHSVVEMKAALQAMVDVELQTIELPGEKLLYTWPE